MLAVCMGVGGASTLAWMGCTVFSTMMIYGVVYGFFAGGVISLFPTVVAELYGIQRLGTVIGILYTGTAFGNLLAAPIAGFIYDATHEYYGSISLAGGLLLIATVFVLTVDKSKKFDFELAAHGPKATVTAESEQDGVKMDLAAVEEGKQLEMVGVEKQLEAPAP
jgi:MFS family permease